MLKNMFLKSVSVGFLSLGLKTRKIPLFAPEGWTNWNSLDQMVFMILSLHIFTFFSS